MNRIISMIAVLCIFVANAMAQTSFAPFNLTSNKENVNYRLNDGSTFVGDKYCTILNGQVNSTTYHGTLTKPSGVKFISQDWGGGFDANFNVQNQTNLWVVYTDGTIKRQWYNNGRLESETNETRNYGFNGPYIVIYTDSYSTGGYNGGGSGSYNNNNSSSGSSYNRHEATCRGCNGSGSCSLCGGAGKKYVNNHYINCSRCHGTGRCQSCAGTGKIHGNF